MSQVHQLSFGEFTEVSLVCWDATEDEAREALAAIEGEIRRQAEPLDAVEDHSTGQTFFVWADQESGALTVKVANSDDFNAAFPVQQMVL
jgi:hypothetical protein